MNELKAANYRIEILEAELDRLRCIEEAALMVSLQYPNKEGKVWRDLRTALEEK